MPCRQERHQHPDQAEHEQIGQGLIGDLRDGVGGAVLANRIDDLIVRVSWNMYRTRGPVR